MFYNLLNQWCSKWGSWIIGSLITWELVEIKIFSTHPPTASADVLDQNIWGWSHQSVFCFEYLFMFIYLAAQGLICGMWDLVPQPGIKLRAPSIESSES